MVKFSLYDSKRDAPEDFGRNKRQKTIKLNDNFRPIPLHERSDQLPSTASAINKGTDFVPIFRGVGRHPRASESEILYQTAAGNFRGSRKIRSDAYTYRTSMKTPMGLAAKRYLVDEEHYLNTKNEARFGLHGVNQPSRQMYKSQDPNTVGASNHTRYAGMERHRLSEFYPRLPESVPEDMVEVNVPNRDAFRFNDTSVEEAPQVYPDFGF